MSENQTKPAEWHGAKMDFKESMSYGDYLGLGQILSAQHPLSPNHNEMLFIIQHQTSELWIKLMLHELNAVRVQLRAGELDPAFKMLTRVARIMDQLVHAWDVLATMTPSEYTAIRPYLGASSGFQSHQYRELEFILGNKNPALLAVHEKNPPAHAVLERARTGTGHCTNWPKSWSTSRRPSASGASATSPRSSASSASRPAPAALPA
jgi:tryptophan 2,3-dioxygenase